MARQSDLWKKNEDGISVASPEGADILLRGNNRYLNFKNIFNEDGYGIRDNSGVIEFKNESGVWQSVGTGGTPTLTWSYFATTWSVEPSFNEAITGGDVYNYTLDGTTRYRFVPTVYDATQDAFYSTFSGGVLSDIIVARG